MLRIHDPETDASLDLHIPWMLEEAFRVQLGRHLDSGGQSRFLWEVAGWFTAAIYQLVDRDLLPPTERQRALAARISTALGIDLPSEANTFRGSMSDFIRYHLPAFQAFRATEEGRPKNRDRTS
ncbi:hypothetical protein [Dyella sp.]|uniref:hypothetical protein n=1 Tax=Dyella sp. TaxID=1869338 RepID=UPI002ED31EAC